MSVYLVLLETGYPQCISVVTGCFFNKLSETGLLSLGRDLNSVCVCVRAQGVSRQSELNSSDTQS